FLKTIRGFAEELFPLEDVVGELAGVGAGGDDSGGLAKDGIGVVWVSQVVVKGEPERCAGTGRTAIGGDSGLVDIPILAFGADELNCTGTVAKHVLDGRVGAVAVIDGGERRAGIEAISNRAVVAGFGLVTGDEATAVDEDDNGRWLVGLGLPE